MMKNIQLSNYCRWDDSISVKNFLNKYADIDILYENGIYFRFAVKNDNVNILNNLFQYFEKTKLQEHPQDIYSVPLARCQLQEILREAVETYEFSEEMQTALNRYLPKEGEETEQGLTDIENVLSFNSLKSENDLDEHYYDSELLIGKDSHCTDSN